MQLCAHEQALCFFCPPKRSETRQRPGRNDRLQRPEGVEKWPVVGLRQEMAKVSRSIWEAWSQAARKVQRCWSERFGGAAAGGGQGVLKCPGWVCPTSSQHLTTNPPPLEDNKSPKFYFKKCKVKEISLYPAFILCDWGTK